MGLVIDTCVFVSAERKGQIFSANDLEFYENVYMSAITLSELLVGVHLASTEAKRLKRSAFVETIAKEIMVLDFTAETARLHAELDAYLTKKSNQIGAHDLLIAATALTFGYALLTSNSKEFERVPGLQVVKF